MSAIVTAFASTSTSALACRDGLSALADLYRDLGTASSREISQVMAVLESIPSPPTPGPHTGPVGSTMMKIAEKTRNVRQSLSTHVLELEFLGCEAETLALGVAPLADAFPLPAALQHAVRPAPYEERPVPCEKCSRPLSDVFRNCQYCEAHASTPGAPTPLTVIDDAEADIDTIIGDIRNGRVTVGETLTADERRHKRHAEVMAAQANADAIARLEEAEYDQLPASVFSRTAQECVGPVCEICNDVGDFVRERGDGLTKCEPCQIAHDVLAQEIGADGIKQAMEDVAGALAEAPPPVLMHCPGCKQETRVPVGALDAVINCPTCLLTSATTVPLAEGPAPEPTPEPAPKKASRRRKK